MIYPVNDIYVAIQGEGCQTGVPMVLLRLQGCEVSCQFCDTKETWDLDSRNWVDKDDPLKFDKIRANKILWTSATAEELAKYIRDEFLGPKWVLVTGGEPSRYDLRELVRALHERDFLVSLETSGTEQGHLQAAFDWVTVSPKIGMPGGKTIIPEVLSKASEVKMVIGKPSDFGKLEGVLPWVNGAQICLQPISQSEKATKLCLDAAIARGYRLSIQVHKYIGVE